MALQFVFGGSGSGKTHYLYEMIMKEAGENPALNYIVLVPEQFTMQTQKDLVVRHERKGIMNIDVLSFGRLAYRVFEETGKGNTPVLDDEGKNLVLQKLAGDHMDELRVLRGNIKKSGYISEVKSVLSEFDQYDIGLEEIDFMMDQLGEETYLHYKLQDIRVMYEAFQNYLADRYITKEELLGVLTDLVPESSILKKSVIVLDGFTGFTPVQNRLLTELMKACREIVVTVTIDAKEDPYRYVGPYELFAMSKHTVCTLINAAKENRIEVKDPKWMDTEVNPRFVKSEALAFLEKNLFRYGRKSFLKEQSDITIHEALNVREEAKAAVSNIRRLVRTKGYRYREIGVIVTEMDVYGDYLKQAFAEYDIPVFMDHKRSILLNSFVEYVRSVVGMVEQQFSYDSVFRFLRAGYGPFSQDDIELLENYCITLGVKGYRKWQQSWIRREKSMTEEELSHLNHLRVRFVELLDELMLVLRQKKKTVFDITQALYQFLAKQEFQLRIKEQQIHFEERGDHALAREYAQVYGAVIGLFDKFVELLGDEPVSIKEYAKLLDAGLEEAKIGVIPPGLDQVIVGDVERTRLKDIRALFVLGINDQYLPGTLLRTGLLGEHDREKFEKSNLRLTPGGKEKAYIQKFYLYLNLTKPEEQLYLSYSRTDGSGKSVRPAYLIAEIKKLFPHIVQIDESKRLLSEKELTPGEGIFELIGGLRGMSEENVDAFMELYSWYLSHSEWADKIRKILEANYWNYHPEKISEQAARLLYGDRFWSSISRMEKFSACAFAHFLSYGLRLQERMEYEFKAMDLGNVFHAAIEKYSKKLQNADMKWTDVKEADRKRLVKECVSESVTDYGNSVLYASARSEYMITRLVRLLDRTVWALSDQLRRGDFVPEEYEMTFDSGKIDRVDVCEDGDELYLKVMDYKTGRTEFDISAYYHGLQLQLMVYMNAAVGEMKKKYPGKEIIPSGVFYYRISDPFVDRKEKEDSEKQILEQLRMDGLVNLKKNSLQHLDRSINGSSTVVPVRINKNGSLAKASKAVSEDEFETMLQYADSINSSLREALKKGDVAAYPYHYGQESGCDYCNYKHVCGFDSRIAGFKYHEIDKLSMEEAVSKMKAKLPLREEESK
ncbi:MAG: PD-(D/E)XK nuclease family protein [Eubacteriales bacterium]|nr:PD-(D/E)XK nuclease family protein [Eubacteriales bacterium]